MSKSMRIQHECASKGIAIGHAHVISASGASYPRFWISDKEITVEMTRFKNAIQRSKHQIAKVKEKLCKFQDKEQIQIIDTHAMLLQDEMLITHAIQNIANQKINAEWALDKATTKLKMAFVDMHDEYFKQRKHDIDHIGRRIMRNLLNRPDTPDIGTKDKNIILIGHDFSPADIVNFPRDRVIGFIAEVGGSTSHSAIIARSLEIPAMFGVENITKLISSGEAVVIDGLKDLIITNPSEKEIRDYKTLRTSYYKTQRELMKEAHLPATTLDKNQIDIFANIELPEEIDPSIEHGAEGIGLFRTEYLYANRMDSPSEEEQFEIYKLTLEKMSPHPVTIRTLDIGGDKLFTGSEYATHGNPALGLRAIRFCLAEMDIFKTQLRALLRASPYGNLRIMVPMISGLDEVRQVKKLLADHTALLTKEGHKVSKDIKLGIMIETPSAVMLADDLAQEVDFFSIGTNDLIQYTLAVDRTNEYVAYLYSLLHPAVVRMIKRTIDAARKHAIEITVCGEAAGDPLYLLLFLGAGVSGLSMNPVSIPKVKKLLRSVTFKEAVDLFNRILAMKTTEEIERTIKTEMTKHLEIFQKQKPAKG